MLSGFSGDKLKYGFTEITKLFSNNALYKNTVIEAKIHFAKNPS